MVHVLDVPPRQDGVLVQIADTEPTDERELCPHGVHELAGTEVGEAGGQRVAGTDTLTAHAAARYRTLAAVQ
jgi:hypothetical protein